MFNIPRTQGRCRSWASAVCLHVLFHGPLIKYGGHNQHGLSVPLGPAHPRPAQPVWRNWRQDGPWPQTLCHICALCTQGCLSPARASCPLRVQTLNPSILAPAQLKALCKGLLLVSEGLVASLIRFPGLEPTLHHSLRERTSSEIIWTDLSKP